MVEGKRSPNPIWSALILLALVAMVPINFVIGSVFVMGADPCLGFRDRADR